MSQVAKIIDIKIDGHPFLGCLRPTNVEGPAAPTWSNNPEQVMDWLTSAWRNRFNEYRALRTRYLYEPDPDTPGKNRKITDSQGEPILQPIGHDPQLVMTDSKARKATPHYSSVPSMILQTASRHEDTEYWAAIERRKTLKGKGRYAGKLPGMKKNRSDKTLVLYHNNGVCGVYRRTGRRTGILTIAGRNTSPWRGDKPSRWQIHIRIRHSQDIRPYTSVHVNWTTKRVIFVNAPAPIEKTPTGSIIGIDMGVAHTITTSDGRHYDQPDTSDLDRKVVKAQRKMAKARKVNNPSNAKGWKPTKGYDRWRKKSAEAQAAKARRLGDWRHKTTSELVRENDVIIIEDLAVRQMLKSARGTKENPGKNVAQKRGLNRAIVGSGWGDLRSKLLYKSRALCDAGYRQVLVAVDPRDTSRECNECHHVAPENRESQAVFRCVSCGHCANADVNAACNVCDRGVAFLEGLDESQVWTGGKTCVLMDTRSSDRGRLGGSTNRMVRSSVLSPLVVSGIPSLKAGEDVKPHDTNWTRSNR